MDIFVIIMAGVIATTTMIGTMWFIHYFKWANADMVRAVGSLYTRSYEWSLLPGLATNYLLGISFALIYAKLVGLSPVLTQYSVLVITTFAGMAHGIVVGLLLEIVVAEHHPLVQFRKVGFPVVAAHIVGLGVYGFTLGVVFALNIRHVQNAVEYYISWRAVGDFLGFGFIWLPLFGPPVLFLGYLLYVILTSEVRTEARNLHDQNETQDHKPLPPGEPAENQPAKKAG